VKHLARFTIILGIIGGLVGAFFDAAARKAGEKLIEWVASFVTTAPNHPTSPSKIMKVDSRPTETTPAVRPPEQPPNQNQVVEPAVPPSGQLRRPWDWR
jgi:hypothetical protein